MRKLLLALVVFLCGLSVSSQIYTPVVPVKYGDNLLRAHFFKALGFPDKDDTTTDTNDQSPQIFYHHSDTSWYSWSSDVGFRKFGTGGGGGGGIPDTFYVCCGIDTNLSINPGFTTLFWDSTRVYAYIDSLFGISGGGGTLLSVTHAGNTTDISFGILSNVAADGERDIVVSDDNGNIISMGIDQPSGTGSIYWNNTTGNGNVNLRADSAGSPDVDTLQLPRGHGTLGISVNNIPFDVNGNVTVSSSGWSLTGNSGTTYGTNFIGTTDVTDLMFKLNSQKAGSIEQGNTTSNTSFGYIGLFSLTTGDFNASFGFGSGAGLKTASNNTAIGYSALPTDTSGGNNTAVGYIALNNITNGHDNTAIGFQAGNNWQTGSYNVALGSNAAWNAVSGTYQTMANTLILGDSTYHMQMKLDSAVGTAPSVIGKASDGKWHTYVTPSGGGGTVTSVSGTTNRITSTGGATPVLDISATFEALLGKVANPLSQFASTTSAQLLGVLSDETGTGVSVFATNPTLSGATIADATDIALNTTTGTKFGTSTSQKLAFFNSTPIVKPTGNTLTALTNLGLIATPTLAESDVTNLTTDLSSKAGLDIQAITAYQAMGSVIKATPIGLALNGSTGQLTMVDGAAYYIAIYIPKAMTLTGVKLTQTTAGNYNADNYNGVALYSVSAGTLTLVDSSVNDGNIWKATSNTMITKAFTTTYSAAAGVYYIALLWNTSDGAPTTVPIISSVAQMNSSVSPWDFTNSLFLGGRKTSNTIVPSTVAASTITNQATFPFATLY